MQVPIETYCWLCLSALLAGMVNALAGGGTLLTFPALMSVVPPVMANATSTVALVPGSIASAWGFRRELAQTERWSLVLLVPSLVGGCIGAMLVTRLHESYFKALVPWLILTATLLLLLQPVVVKLTKKEAQAATQQPRNLILMVCIQFLVAVYGGYFGAGIGILMLGSLALMGLQSMHHMNALKVALALAINGISVVVFVIEKQVNWELALPMAAAAIAGGYLGARLTLRLKQTVVRWIVIAIGFTLAGYYFFGSTPTSEG